MSKINKYRFVIWRRIVQLSLLLLFAGGNYFGWKIVQGNYSSASLFDKIPLADPYAFLQILVSGFIGATDIIVGAIIVFLLYALIFGRMFCTWVCPVNIIADTAIWLIKKLNLKTSIEFSRNSRYGIMILGLLLSAILGIAAFELVSPVSMMHRGVIFGFGAGWAVILALFLFDVSITKYGWCGHLCPLGAFYSLIGRFAILKVYHLEEKCTNCKDCFKVCHEEQVLSIVGKESGYIKSGECTNCASCIEVCNDDALKFSLRYVTKTDKNNQL